MVVVYSVTRQECVSIVQLEELKIRKNRRERHIVRNVIENATMNTVKYHNGVVQFVVLPFANEIGDDFVVVDHNQRLNRTRLINTSVEFHRKRVR